jgi:hypothetical protein
MKETIEEAAKKAIGYKKGQAFNEGYTAGAKWQAKRMYSEANKIISFLDNEYKLGISDKQTIKRLKWYFETYFEQFSKK